MYFGWWTDTGIGVYSPGVKMNADDIRYFDQEHKMGFHEDLPGNDDDGIAGSLGVKIWPPDDFPPEKIKWGFSTIKSI